MSETTPDLTEHEPSLTLSEVADRLFESGAGEVHTVHGTNPRNEKIHIRALTVETDQGRYELLEYVRHNERRLNFISEDNVAWPRLHSNEGVVPNLMHSLAAGRPVDDEAARRRYAELRRLLNRN